MTKERKEYAQFAYMQNPSYMQQKTRRQNFYFPGKTPGQPYKFDPYKQCYSFIVLQGDDSTNKFTSFVQLADRKINLWESKLGRKNPHNPFRMNATFTV